MTQWMNFHSVDIREVITMPEIKLIEDVANKSSKHIKKNQYWLKNNIAVARYGLPMGDYILVNDRVQDMLDRKAKRNIPPKKMDFIGTYDVCVDTKYSIQEIIMDLCGKEHERFRYEALLCEQNNVQLIVLIENDFEWISKSKNIYNEPVRSIDDLFHWKNKRAFMWSKGKQLYPNCTKGSTLAKTMITFAERYNVRFEFCGSAEAGAKVIELLQGGKSDVK